MTRLLQTLVSSVAAPPPQLPVQVTPGPVDKVLNWDTTGTGGAAGQQAGALLHLSQVQVASELLQGPLRAAPVPATEQDEEKSFLTLRGVQEEIQAQEAEFIQEP